MLVDPMLRNSQRVPVDPYAAANSAYASMRSGTPPGPGANPNGMSLATGPNTTTAYGYGQAPGSGPGYYEQQTPAGSFVAGDARFAQGAAPVGQQWATNPLLGQQAQGVGPQGSVQPWAQQIAGYATRGNPFMGQQSEKAQQTGANAFGGGNPFLGQAIDAASADAIRNYNTAIRPQLDSLGRASGSFGNTAIQELQQNAMGDLGRNLGNIASGMRMQDYTQQQQLAESALNRQQQVNLTNAGLGAADLARNMGGFFQGQQIGMQGLGQQLGAAQFDNTLDQQGGMFNAGQGNQMAQFNANLTQGLSQFNAGQGNALGQFNASLGQANNQFNAGQGNAMSQFNAGQGNNMLNQYRTLLEQGRQFDANLDNNRYQFDQNLDWNIDQGNWNRQRAGLQDSLGIYDRMNSNSNQAFDLGTALQNMPLAQQQAFTQLLAQLGGMGGTSTAAQPLQGNPLLGAIGGWQLGGQLWRP